MDNDSTRPQWFTGSEHTHRVARAIAQYGPIARTTLAQILGLSQGALSRITSDLIYDGVIEELPTDMAGQGKLPLGFVPKDRDAGERRGRPQTALRLRASERTFVGANIHSTNVSVQHVDALCRPLAPCITVPLDSTAPEDVAGQVARLVGECLAPDAPAPTTVGVSIGGHPDEDRYMTYAPFLHWNGRIDFGGMLRRACGLPCAVFNDLDSLLLHEEWFGAAVGIPRFAVLTIGVGVGYSLAENGVAVDYPDKSYGLAAHVLVDPDGPRCNAGHRGCSQCLTADSIAAEYSDITGSTCSFEDFIADVNHGKPYATRLAERVCFRLGVLIATIGNIAMPTKVLISGESSFLASMYYEVVCSGIRQYSHSLVSAVDFEVLPFDWSYWAQAAGARAIARYIG